MNIKVAAFTVSEKSSNTRLLNGDLYMTGAQTKDSLDLN